MNDYTIFTDSACDIPKNMLEEWGVELCEMTVTFEDESDARDNSEISIKEFYQKIRDGGIAHTSSINPGYFQMAFEQRLKEGKDILYLCFSSGLSTTYQSALIAKEELERSYPEREIIVVDTLCASGGFGLMVYLTAMEKKRGASLHDAAKFAEDTMPHLCHWFTVDDLVYLKRGGRVSAATAAVAGVLNIKPIMHVDNEGHLINMSKVRGRKNAIKAMADKYGELALTPDGGTVFVSHGDCEEDAFALRDMLVEQYSAPVKLVFDVGPIIGAHTGPGVLTCFFLGKER